MITIILAFILIFLIGVAIVEESSEVAFLASIFFIIYIFVLIVLLKSSSSEGYVRTIDGVESYCVSRSYEVNASWAWPGAVVTKYDDSELSCTPLVTP